MIIKPSKFDYGPELWVQGVHGLVLGWELYHGNKNIASGSTESFSESK